VYNRIHADGTNNVLRPCDKEPLFIGKAFKNGAEHPHWINRNWPAIEEDLKELRSGNCYLLKLPLETEYKDFDFITWFVFSYMKEIHARSLHIPFEPAAGFANVQQIGFGKPFVRTANSETNWVFLSKQVIDELLAEKRKKYDQENMLMRLENLTVLLWPLKGTKGWKEYAAIAQDIACVPSRALERVKISVEIEISVRSNADKQWRTLNAGVKCSLSVLSLCLRW